MDDLIFQQAEQTYIFCCKAMGEPVIPRYKAFSYKEGDIVYLGSGRGDSPVKYSISGNCILG